MTTDGIIALIALGVGCLGGFLALLKYLMDQIAQEQAWREEADEKIREEAETFYKESRNDRRKIDMDDQTRYTSMYREMSDFKLYIANNYTSIDTLRETEERLTATMEKIAARIETIATRIERMALEIATLNNNKGRRQGGLGSE